MEFIGGGGKIAPPQRILVLTTPAGMGLRTNGYLKNKFLLLFSLSVSEQFKKSKRAQPYLYAKEVFIQAFG